MAKKWTEEETERFKDIYPNVTNKEISKIFSRSITSIQRKATKLGLHKSAKHISTTWSNVRMGEKSSSWKGGKFLNSKGYIVLNKRGYPGADKHGKIFEHRYLMEQHLGRLLEQNEVIHHLNGNKLDNRIENLQVMTNGEHTIKHHNGMKRSKDIREKISNKAKQRWKRVGKKGHPSYKKIDVDYFKEIIINTQTTKEAAELLGIAKRTLYSKLEEFNLREWYVNVKQDNHYWKAYSRSKL